MQGDRELIKFYVLIPVYKTEQFIRRCIDSVLDQTYSNYEVILVDDGSPDLAGDICDKYAENDNRIHVIHKENGGAGSARQSAVSFVKKNRSEENGFFIFLDSDDYLQSNALTVIEEAICQHNCDVVIYGIQRVSEQKKFPFEQNVFVGTITDKRDLYKRVFFSMSYNSLCRKAVSCNLLMNKQKIEFYGISHGEDLIQSIPIYKNCKKVVFIEDILYNYYSNPDSITNKFFVQRLLKEDAVVRGAVWRFLQEENLFSEEDIRDYWKMSIKSLYKLLLEISIHLDLSKDYSALFHEIVQYDFYMTLLNNKEINFLLRWLKNERFRRIILFAKIRRYISKIYHCVMGVIKNDSFRH